LVSSDLSKRRGIIFHDFIFVRNEKVLKKIEKPKN